ncbi:hypothetical protein K502DRAFT_152247 [Neoconidiobolus thromboides FSU 785]|nr:hypothetical protein K502DRAFT_152247 [Neoconidiobolus thromboides FSU 785]
MGQESSKSESKNPHRRTVSTSVVAPSKHPNMILKLNDSTHNNNLTTPSSSWLKNNGHLISPRLPRLEEISGVISSFPFKTIDEVEGLSLSDKEMDVKISQSYGNEYQQLSSSMPLGNAIKGLCNVKSMDRIGRQNDYYSNNSSQSSFQDSPIITVSKGKAHKIDPILLKLKGLPKVNTI